MIVLEVLVPPGEGAVNRKLVTMHRRRKGKRLLLPNAPRYQAFKAAVALEAARAAWQHGRLDEGELAVAVVEYWPRVHRSAGREGIAYGDVDAPLKAVLDGLKDGGLIDDDARVVAVHAKKHHDALCPRVLVSVWRI